MQKITIKKDNGIVQEIRHQNPVSYIGAHKHADAEDFRHVLGPPAEKRPTEIHHFDPFASP